MDKIVRMLTTMAGPEGVFRSGDSLAFPEEVADILIARGYAVELEPTYEPEVAAVEPAEKAVKPRPRRRKRVVK